MNRPRPGRLIWVVAGLALLAGQALVAQPATVAPLPEAPSPSELYRDVKALRLVDRLELTPTQIEKILPVVQAVADQAAADAQADAAAWQTVEAASAKVLSALLAGVDPPQAEMEVMNQAATERNQREDHRAAMVADAAVQIQRMLTAEQAGRIETAARQAQRKAQQARMDGAETPVDYIVTKLDQQAELMPDEYLRTRNDRAAAMADAILGPNAPDGRALATTLLGIMDQVANWTPQQYAQQRPTLAQQVAKALSLPEDPNAGLIRYDDFSAWISSDRTPKVLKELLAARGPADEGEVTP